MKSFQCRGQFKVFGEKKGKISLGFTPSKGRSPPQAFVLRWQRGTAPFEAKTLVLAKKKMHALFAKHIVCFITHYRDPLDTKKPFMRPKDNKDPVNVIGLFPLVQNMNQSKLEDFCPLVMSCTTRLSI